MATKNRFKTNSGSVDFNDPSVLVSPQNQVNREEEIKPQTIVDTTASDTSSNEGKMKSKNLLAGKFKKKPESKTYSLYLDGDVIAALDELANENNVSRSNALNALLRDVLLGE